MMNRVNSAKNSMISAFFNASVTPVHTKEMLARYQNKLSA